MKKEKFNYTPINYSPITGKIYHPTLKPAKGWDFPHRLKTAVHLSEMFCFDLKNPYTTEKNILNAIEILKYLYEIENISTPELNKMFGNRLKTFTTFLKPLGIKVKTLKESVKNYHIQMGTIVTDKKKIYKKECNFSFDPYSIDTIPGYNLLLKYGIYNTKKNINGMTRDHIISVDYGFYNNIDPKIISHPANCRFISVMENSKKGNGNGMDIQELLIRIKEWDNNPPLILRNKSTQLPKTESQKEKIRNSCTGKININNGIINLRILPTQPIPQGYQRGMTKRKMSGE